MTNETRYKKALVNILFYQAINMRKEELQPVLFFEEMTTDFWTLEQCRMQYIKDQLQFIDDGNLDDEIEETWNTVFKKENV
jgi:flagellar motor component MotA